MIDHLKRIIARLRSSGAWLPPGNLPEDPDLGVREPKWRRPSGGSTAAAVTEPKANETTSLTATPR